MPKSDPLAVILQVTRSRRKEAQAEKRSGARRAMRCAGGQRRWQSQLAASGSVLKSRNDVLAFAQLRFKGNGRVAEEYLQRLSTRPLP